MKGIANTPASRTANTPCGKKQCWPLLVEEVSCLANVMASRCPQILIVDCIPHNHYDMEPSVDQDSTEFKKILKTIHFSHPCKLHEYYGTKSQGVYLYDVTL